MKSKIDKTTIVLTVGNLTDAKTGAIVNAANEKLAAGAGVCGAIYDACGHMPFKECKDKYPKGIRVGQAIMTSGGKQNYKVIHAVGPMWDDALAKLYRRELISNLDAAYWNSLLIADENDITSISYPSLATGIYGFPLDVAVETAWKSINEFLTETEHNLELVQFVLFSGDNYKAYANGLRALVGDENVQDELSDAEIATLTPKRRVMPLPPLQSGYTDRARHASAPQKKAPKAKYDSRIEFDSYKSDSQYGGLFSQSKSSSPSKREDVGDGFELEWDEGSDVNFATIYRNEEIMGTIQMDTDLKWKTDWDDTPYQSRNGAIRAIKEAVKSL